MPSTEMIEARITTVFQHVELALGRRRDAAEVRQIMEEWVPFEVDDQEDRVYYIARKSGIALVFLPDVLDTVFFYFAPRRGYRPFRDEVIRGVGSAATRPEVLASLGEPAESGSVPVIRDPSQRAQWLKYLVGRTVIHFSFVPDGSERLDVLRVFRPR